jgi:hypothetical protein
MTLTPRDQKLMTILLPVVMIAAYWFLLLSPQRKEASKLGEEVTLAETARDEAVAKSQGVTSAKGDFATDFAEVLRVGKAIPTTVDMPALLVQLDKAADGTGIEFKSVKAGTRTQAQPPPPAPAPAEGEPADAGGEDAESAPGEAAETAAEGTETADAASAESGADPASTGTAAPGTPDATGSTTPGLDTVPLDFTFEGDFFELADFFHKLKRFVHVRNDRIVVGGRLMTIDSFTLSMDDGFPNLTAMMTATVYLSPLSEGATAGASPEGPAPVGADGAPQPAGTAAPAPAPTAPTSSPAQ